MVSFIGRSGHHVLFGDEDSAVVVDARVSVVSAFGSLSELTASRTWGPGEYSESDQSAAGAAFESMAAPIPEATGRLYTVPKGVQMAAQRAMSEANKNKSEFSAASLRMGETLAQGGQIEFTQLVNVFNHLSRKKEAVEKSSVTASGSPSPAQISWDLYGGSAALKWAGNIVSRESIVASGPPASENLTELLANPEAGPEFIARLNTETAAIDRLYRIDIDGQTYVWEDDTWDDFGHPNWAIWQYDTYLDGDTAPDITHVLIDPESAIYIAANLKYGLVYVEDINLAETKLVKAAAPELDWELLDRTVTAAGGTPGDGIYTPDERSENASNQVRDKTGKFAKQGGRVMVNGVPGATGIINRVNPANGTVEISMDSGGTQVVKGNQVETVGQYTTTIPGKPMELPKVDFSGILAEPRTPINRVKGQIPGTLPAMTADDLHSVINNFPAWVKSQREQFKGLGGPNAVSVQAKNSLDTGKTGQQIKQETGKGITTDAYDHPLLNKWLNTRGQTGYYENKLWYRPIVASAGALTPEESDVQPVYMAVVSPDDPRAVFKLISLVPASAESTAPAVYSREDGQWVLDAQTLNDLRSATPPPVVPLTSDALNDVLIQVDDAQGESAEKDAETAAEDAEALQAPIPDESALPPGAPPVSEVVVASAIDDLDFNLMVLWGPKEHIMQQALTAAGGLDRNRGGARKLRLYWTKGPGAAKIMWGTPGDWTRCVRYLGKYMGPRAKGYCFTGDTPIITRDGVFNLEDLVGTKQFVLTNPAPIGGRSKPVNMAGRWVEAPIEYYGDQPVLTVTLSRNKQIKTVRATPEHEWFASLDGKSSARKSAQIIQTRDLKPGMSLATLFAKSNTDRSIPSPFGVAAGFTFGDGSLDGARGARVDLWGAKDSELLPFFDGCTAYPTTVKLSGVKGYRVSNLPASWKKLPAMDEGHSYLFGWLAGYLAADGTVSKRGTVSLSSAKRENLEHAKTVATLLGIGTYGITMQMRVGTGTEPTALYKMAFVSETVPPHLLVTSGHQENFNIHGAASKNTSPTRWTVVSVKDHGEVEPVYCAEVPDTETFALADNIWVHNCALRHKEMTGMWTGDREHRQVFSANYVGKLHSTELVESSENIINSSVLKVRSELAQTRVITAGAGQAEPFNVIYPTKDTAVEAITAAAWDSRDVGGAFWIPIALPEDIESGDGRLVEKGAAEIRTLPISLLWQFKTASGHDGSVVVGRIERLRRIPGGIGNGYGHFDTGPWGREAERMVRNGMLRFVSADMDKFGAVKEKAEEKDAEASEKEDIIEADKVTVKKARVMAVTIVAKPAFQEATIQIVPDEPLLEEEVFPDGIFAEEPDPMDVPAILAAGYIAEAVPVIPPRQWFDKPSLDGPTPITVTDDGKVFGHIAAWNSGHINPRLNGINPPRSKSGYSYFHTGVLRTEEGDVPVGQLTLAGGHAGLEASAAEAVKHYDDTGSAVADVHAGEDEFGIWVSGALRPGVTPEQVRAFRASAPSGDWRPIRGALELVAVCQVNVPGFPIARAFVASGEMTALVAAGALPLAKMKSDPIAELTARLERVEHFEQSELSARAEAIRSRVEPVLSEQKALLQARAEAVFSTMETFGYVPKKTREKAAEKGQALPDGSYPIRNVTDLKNAIRAYGRAKESEQVKVRKHIMKRARVLGREDLIPAKWSTAGSEALTASVEQMRSRIAEFNSRYAEEELRAIAADKESEEPVSEQDRPKYTPGKDQPRDYKGQFRDVLARLKDDLGDSGNQGVVDKIRETDAKIQTGDYVKAVKGAMDLRDVLDRLDENILDSENTSNIREAAKNLGTVISNMPLPFTNQAAKVRFSDLPPALGDLIDDLISRVENRINPEDAAEAVSKLKAFKSGSDVFSQGEISAEMSRMLRLLT